MLHTFHKTVFLIIFTHGKFICRVKECIFKYLLNYSVYFAFSFLRTIRPGLVQPTDIMVTL
jgi:hypothetical protein